MNIKGNKQKPARKLLFDIEPKLRESFISRSKELFKEYGVKGPLLRSVVIKNFLNTPKAEIARLVGEEIKKKAGKK